jgi:hypothetical protein
MMPSKSHAQKRKEKLKKRAEKKPLIIRPEPYFGLHWRQKADCVHTLLAAEFGISCTWQLVGHRWNLCDDDVVAGVESLILRLRAGQRLLPDPDECDDLPDPQRRENNADLFVDMVLKQWFPILKAGQLPGREDLIGILRTILGSISSVRVQRPGSTRYLQFVTNWLKEDYEVEITSVTEGTTISEIHHDETEKHDDGSQVIGRVSA